METNEDVKYTKLRSFNAFMGVFHFVQGALILYLSNAFALPVNTSFLKFDAVNLTVAPVLNTVSHLRIGPLVALFLFISAVDHFFLASIGFPWYVRNLKKHINYARWYEYALSSSVMIVAIAMLSGFYELGGLILIFSLNATMNLFGLMMELHNQTAERTNWTAFIFGSFAGIVPWIVILIYFYGAISQSTTNVPTFVYGILASLAFFFFLFPLNMVLQYKKIGKWKDYLYGERGYIILSLIAKTALAWQVFGGTLRAM